MQRTPLPNIRTNIIMIIILIIIFTVMSIIVRDIVRQFIFIAQKTTLDTTQCENNYTKFCIRNYYYFFYVYIENISHVFQ